MMYVSLKWKIMLISSCLLAALFIVRLTISLQYLEKSFNEQRTETFAQNYRIANNIINQLYTDLQRLATTTTTMEGMAQALHTQDTSAIEKTFDEYWFQLQLENDISTVAIFSAQGKRLAIWGEETYPSDIVDNVISTSKPSWSILCTSNCYIYAAIAVLVEGIDAGVVLYGMPLSAFVISYAELTSSQAGLALEKPGKLTGADSMELLALNERDKNLPVIRQVMSQTGISQLMNSPQRVDTENAHYDVAAMDIPDQLGEQRGYLLFINDITDKVSANNKIIRDSYRFEILAFALVESSLFLLLIGPLNRIRNATSYMPLLAQNAFVHVRETLAKTTRNLGIMDEADTLNHVAIELSQKLETLQNELEDRAEALEHNAIDLRKERDFVTGLLDTAHALIITHDADGRIKLVNHYACWISGFEENELLSKSFESLFPFDQYSNEIAQNLHALSTGERNSYQHETPLQCLGGELLYMAWYHSSLKVADSLRYDILTVGLDISERKKAEDHLGWLASHDPLTSLFNRRRFTEELERALSMSIRHKRSGALVYFDIDHFKEVNDTCGHHIGDILLKRIADTVRQITRETDVLARFGGDEFALLMAETSINEATTVVERICESIANLQISHQGKQLHVSSSIGVTIFPEQGDNIAELMSNADMAMYCIKKSGRNGWCLFDENIAVKHDSQERIYWSQMVKQSMHEDIIDLFFQPICHIGSRQISHYETLLRIRQDESFLPPTDFIRAAEESGLIKKVDETVIQKAFAYQHRLQRNNRIVSLAINLSGQSFQNPQLFEHIRLYAQAYSIQPDRIIFEITETSAVSDIDLTCKNMLTLKQDGFKFALDDFGSGFSSLYYLKQFPIDFIKIDGAFIKNIARDMEDRVLVKTIVEAARAFNLKTIAEFVENQEIIDLLAEIGVDYAQGYYINKPASFDETWPALPQDIRAATN